MPTLGYLKPFHKESLGSILDDIYNDCSINIDAETGALFNHNELRKNKIYDSDVLKLGDIWENNKEENTVNLKNIKKYLLHKKKKELEGRGINVDELMDNIHEFNFDYMLNINPNLLKVNDYSKYSDNYEEAKNTFKNCSIFDFLDLVLAEQGNNLNKLVYHNNKSNFELENEVDFDELLLELKSIKDEIKAKLHEDWADEEYFNNKIELETIKRISISEI